MNKHPIKSKTINSAIIIIIIALMNIIGIGDKQIAQTYDTMTDGKGTTEQVKDIGVVAGAIGVIYGRYRVGKGKDENKK
jgi:hypothetical protein